MYQKHDLIDDRFKVLGTCSDTGGMGRILFVTDTTEELPAPIVLKYCKADSSEILKRFRREVRLLSGFQGNKRIVQILAHNLEHDPPYFVMPYYEQGDLLTLVEELKDNPARQESVFVQMVECVAEIHSRSLYHRDIKPHNFLRQGDSIVISDFGLSMEVDSRTAFTTPSISWGTQGYAPPEFQEGGFMNADAAGDIFMLGKSFYALLTGRDPVYILEEGIPAPLLHVIERCCELSKQNRYRQLSELRQSMEAAFDVLLDRGAGPSRVLSSLEAVLSLLESKRKFRKAEVHAFVEGLLLLDDDDQKRICLELDERIFSLVSLAPLSDQATDLLKAYEKMVLGQGYGWSFAETIADNMKVIVESDAVPDRDRSRALSLAVHAAVSQNRFAAMGTCREMVMQVESESLGLMVAGLIADPDNSFLTTIDDFECKCEPIRQALKRKNADDLD